MITKDELKNRIDFAFFCAQDSFMQNGSFIPMLDITFKTTKGESKRAVVAIAGGAVDDRFKILYSFGAMFGSQKNAGKIKEVENIFLMINETWISKLGKDADIENAPRPSLDPNRTECLMCVGQTPDGFCLMKGKEIKKVLVENKFKIELVDIVQDYTNIQSNILQKFYDGYEGVIKKGIVFKEEDMPLNKQLKELFN